LNFFSIVPLFIRTKKKDIRKKERMLRGTKNRNQFFRMQRRQKFKSEKQQKEPYYLFQFKAAQQKMDLRGSNQQMQSHCFMSPLLLLLINNHHSHLF
jgi:hypothetical protein